MLKIKTGSFSDRNIQDSACNSVNMKRTNLVYITNTVETNSTEEYLKTFWFDDLGYMESFQFYLSFN